MLCLVSLHKQQLNIWFYEHVSLTYDADYTSQW